MPTDALLAVQTGAAVHTGWNAAVKSGPNTLFDMILVILRKRSGRRGWPPGSSSRWARRRCACPADRARSLF